jgi:hypothetical protein
VIPEPSPPIPGRLLVPISVEALLVTPQAPVSTVPTETVVPFTDAGASEAATLPKPPPLFGAPAARAPGVYLHWAMPDGLTRGSTTAASDDAGGAGDPVGLPPLPDRWVVGRIDYDVLKVRAWVIEADRAAHHDLAGWTEPGPLPAGTEKAPSGRRYLPGPRLTAVAGGDVAWAATVDAVGDRFAFYDDLAGVHTPVAYFVAGWWSDPANDPLANAIILPMYVDRCLQLGWTAPLEGAVVLPDATILHGMVRYVGLPFFAARDPRPAPEALELAVGGTAYSAFAALVAEGTDDQRAAAERVISAFGSGLLARVDAPDGLVAIDEDRHAAAFVGVSGGTRAQPDRVADGDPLGPIGPAPPESLAAGNGAPAADRRAAGNGAPAADRRAAGPPDVVLRHRDAAAPVATATLPPPEPIVRFFRDAPAALPRLFTQADTALLIRGAHRSQRHGGDGRFSPDGLLACRLSHQVVTFNGEMWADLLPDRLRSLGSTAIPAQADLLLRETCLLDDFISHRVWEQQNPALAPATPAPQPQTRAASVPSFLGTMPSPIGLTSWTQAWVPLWCEWELGVRVHDDLSRWTLGAIDLTSTAPDGAREIVVSGRSLLTATTGKAFAAQVRAFLAEEATRDQAGEGQASPGTEAVLAAAATAAEGMDLIAGTFAGVRETLLGLDPRRAGTVRVDAKGIPSDKPPVVGAPLLLAGGAFTIRRLRIVDTWGRFLDVPASVLAKLELSATHRHPAGAPRVTLAPRFQTPSRLSLRLVDPRTADGAPDVEARIDQEHPQLAVSPIAGWLLPDHVDEALECFDASGMPLGQLLHDERSGAVGWEGAPGRPGPVGGPPDPGPDAGARHVARFALGLVAADAAERNHPSSPSPGESALSALLRGIDTTLGTSNPLGSVGVGAVAGLVGRPIAVVRATLTFDVRSDVADVGFSGRDGDALRAARLRAFAALAARAIRVRLGELTRTDDGLLAYVVDDDYEHVRLISPDVAGTALAAGRGIGHLGVLGTPEQLAPPVEAITHPYVSTPPDVLIHPGQSVRLTLLMHPGGRVHATSGVLPRKAIALARDWFHEALERLSPSFRVGPVLVDPTGVRMPRVTGLGEYQAFTRRATPLTWRDDAILAASQTALLPDEPAALQEGWIRVQPAQEG